MMGRFATPRRSSIMAKKIFLPVVASFFNQDLLFCL